MLHPTAAGTAFFDSGFVAGSRALQKRRQTSPKSAGCSKTLYILWDLVVRHSELEEVHHSLITKVV